MTFDRLVGLDDLVASGLVADSLEYAFVIAFQRRHLCDHKVRSNAFKLACSASQFAVVRSTWQKVALLEDLISVVIAVGAEPVRTRLSSPLHPRFG